MNGQEKNTKVKGLVIEKEFTKEAKILAVDFVILAVDFKYLKV